jgi:hypothetical protein
MRAALFDPTAEVHRRFRSVKRWFDRRFASGLPPDAAPVLIERLGRNIERLESAVRDLPVPVLVHRPQGHWSIQEHAGHLGDLEELFARRLDDFERGAAMLHPADLENRKTHEAGHNERPISDLTAAFRDARTGILTRLARMRPADLARVSVHPRLQQPMSVVDLCSFVAEHDDHHLTAIADMASVLCAMPVYAVELLTTIERALPRLTAMDDERTIQRPAPGKWSPREIIGHLIDSASNNHQRFVRARFQDDLVFPGYQQDDWVAAQRYQDADWHDLLALWASFNRHLARVMSTTPDDVRRKSHTRHNLHERASRPVREHEPSTLDFFMEDYVFHLQHHLRQIR